MRARSIILQTLLADTAGKILLAIITIGTLLVILSNALTPAGSILHVSNYTVALLGKYMTYALLAIALDLVMPWACT